MKNKNKKYLKEKLTDTLVKSLVTGISYFLSAYMVLYSTVFIFPMKEIILGASTIFLVSGLINTKITIDSIFDYQKAKKKYKLINNIENEFKKIVDEDKQIYKEKKKEYYKNEKTKFILGNNENKNNDLLFNEEKENELGKVLTLKNKTRK